MREDRARGITVGVPVQGVVAVTGHVDAVSRGGRVVVDRFVVRPGVELGELADGSEDAARLAVDVVGGANVVRTWNQCYYTLWPTTTLSKNQTLRLFPNELPVVGIVKLFTNSIQIQIAATGQFFSLYLPFSDLTNDCQNLAFFDGVSFLPIISKWFLNILTDFVFYSLPENVHLLSVI